MILANKRKETPFDVRDNALDIWQKITELSMRGFGKKARKLPKEPRNFNIWSEPQKNKWYETQKKLLERNESFDMRFISNESQVVDNLCRQMVFLIDRANTLNPQYLHEFDHQRDMQNEVIGICNNLERELDHIVDTIPSNKNYSVILVDLLEKEIALVRGWRKKCLEKRKDIIEKEIARREKIAEKMNFILMKDNIDIKSENDLS